MKNKCTRLGLAVLSMFISLTAVAPVLADGYGPYGHIPEETGFADGLSLTVAAIVVYSVGLSFVVLSRVVKNTVARLS